MVKKRAHGTHDNVHPLSLSPPLHYYYCFLFHPAGLYAEVKADFYSFNKIPRILFKHKLRYMSVCEDHSVVPPTLPTPRGKGSEHKLGTHVTQTLAASSRLHLMACRKEQMGSHVTSSNHRSLSTCFMISSTYRILPFLVVSGSNSARSTELN